MEPRARQIQTRRVLARAGDAFNPAAIPRRAGKVRVGRSGVSWTLFEHRLRSDKAHPLRPRTARPSPRGGPRGGSGVPAGTQPGREPLFLEMESLREAQGLRPRAKRGGGEGGI